jgi:hypothetical protein
MAASSRGQLPSGGWAALRFAIPLKALSGDLKVKGLLTVYPRLASQILTLSLLAAGRRDWELVPTL